MKLTGVRITTPNTTSPVVLSFRDPSSLNKFQVRGITGLDADEIVKRYYASGTTGKRFYDFKLQKRDVGIFMALNPDWEDDETYSDLRDEIWRIIHSTRTGEITIQFMNGATVVAVLVGTIQKLENDLFEKEPALKLTINCIEPMLKAPTKTLVPLAGLDVTDTTVTDAVSTAPHGVYISATFVEEADTFWIKGEDWQFTVPRSAGYQVGDTVHIISEPGSRSLFLRRLFNTIYIADLLTANSIWPMIFPGENHFEMIDSVEWTKIEYTHSFWGV